MPKAALLAIVVFVMNALGGWPKMRMAASVLIAGPGPERRHEPDPLELVPPAYSTRA